MCEDVMLVILALYQVHDTTCIYCRPCVFLLSRRAWCRPRAAGHELAELPSECLGATGQACKRTDDMTGRPEGQALWSTRKRSRSDGRAQLLSVDDAADMVGRRDASFPRHRHRSPSSAVLICRSVGVAWL